MRFDLPAADPTTAAGPLVSANLELDAEFRIIPEQPSRFGTEVAHDMGRSRAHPQGLHPEPSRDAGRKLTRPDTVGCIRRGSPTGRAP